MKAARTGTVDAENPSPGALSLSSKLVFLAGGGYSPDGLKSVAKGRILNPGLKRVGRKRPFTEASMTEYYGIISL